LIARTALPAACAATGQFCEVRLTGQPFVAVSPVQQEPLVAVVPIKCGALRRSTPITVGLPLKVNLVSLFFRRLGPAAMDGRKFVQQQLVAVPYL
jgi:hypothetical protein